MSEKPKRAKIWPFLILLAVLLLGIILSGIGNSRGIISVSPALTYAFAATAVLLIIAALIRIFLVPRFKIVPGRFQAFLEALTGFFAALGKKLRKLGSALLRTANKLLGGECMSRRTKITSLCLFIVILAVLLVGIILTGGHESHGDIQTLMRDAVLHEEGKISLFGLIDVNPALISGFTVTAVLLLFSAAMRIFVIPRFKMVPGKLQLLLETAVGLFDDLAKSNSPHKNGFLGAYIFAAGTYIFVGTLFELFGLQAVTVAGQSIALPAPLSDINAAISMGCLSYCIILSGGIAGNGLKGVGQTLKDFSLPISMSFRLFGALLSGLLVTELVYHFIFLSFIVPVLVGILFTLLHALIQAYVLTMLTALFYGEVSEKHPPKPKKPRRGKLRAKKAAA